MFEAGAMVKRSGKSPVALTTPRPEAVRDAPDRIRKAHLRFLEQTATRPTLSQPAAQSILQNELVAARTLSSERWILDN
jgi:hypothetical protein